MKNYSNTTPRKEKDNFLDAKFKITGSPVGKNLTSNSGVPGSTPRLIRKLGNYVWKHLSPCATTTELASCRTCDPRQKKCLTIATRKSPDTTAKGPSTTRKTQHSQK